MGSHDIPTIPFAEFGGHLLNKALSRRIPMSGTLEITFRCNLNCVHCYCNLTAKDPAAINEEMTRAEYFSILDQIADEGCLWLLITGGEPLIRKDFLDIYTYAKKRGFLITLFTNGTLITPKIADHLAEWPPHEMEITLYGTTQKTHERITGSHGSYQRCLQGIELLRERKIPLDIKTAVMTLNKKELPRIRAFAERLGMAFRFDPLLTSRLDGVQTPRQLRLSPQEVVALDKADEKREQEWRKEFKKPVEWLQPDKLFPCGAGVTSFHIDPYGKMSICDMCRFHHYDLRAGSFQEGWEENIPLLLDTRRETDSPCYTCPWTDQCYNCPGWSWMENGKMEEPMDYLCTITRLRAKAFG